MTKIFRLAGIIILLFTAAGACKKTAVDASSLTIVSFDPISGPAGTQVTITGTNFSDLPSENTVEFNGTPAQVTGATATELIVIVPAAATTGKIKVTNVAGTVTSANNFQVTAPVNAWTQAKNFPGPGRRGAVAFVINEKGYVATGITTTEGAKDVWAYDPATDAWTQKADFKGKVRDRAIGFALGNKGYVGLGNSGALNFEKDLWEYDPATNDWTKKADFKGAAREYASVFTVGGKAYVGLGNDGAATYKKDFWEYDPANNSWAQKANFGGPPQTLSTGFSIGNKGYIAGGWDGIIYAYDIWEYDPTGNTWTKKKPFPGKPRAYAVAFTIGSKGYFGTGFGIIGPHAGHLGDLWEYDAAHDAWTEKAPIGSVARQRAVGFSIGNKGYVGLGQAELVSILNDFWEYEQ